MDSELTGAPAYPAAREAARRVHPHFAAHHAAARRTLEEAVAELPAPKTLEALIDAAFWASLRREEGLTPRISLAWLPPDASAATMRFDKSIALAPETLTKLAPAVERPGIHLTVWTEESGLRVWGATRNLPAFCFVIEVVAPGLLVIKHSRGEASGKFVNVAVLQGDQIKVIDQRTPSTPDCPALLTSLIGLDEQFAPIDSVNVLIQIAASMRAHGRGGTLLVVPDGSGSWRDSVLQPIGYCMSPPYSGLADVMQRDPSERPRRRWREALRGAVDAIAGLTAVDGATVITASYDLLAFGAKIIRRAGRPTMTQVLLTEPIEGVERVVVEPAYIGGTRHLSAAQFTHDQPDAIALVASVDGRFTVFGWSPCEGMVHAHRIEALLL